MSLKDVIYEPFKSYNEEFKNKINEESNKYFNELVKKSGISIEKDSILKKERDNLIINLNEKSNILKKVKNKKNGFTFLAVFSLILSIILILIGVYNLKSPVYIPILLIIGGVILIGLSIFLFIYISKKINPLVKESSKNEKAANQKLKEKEEEMSINMSCLNDLFDYGMQNEIISKAIPLIQLDKEFDISKYTFLNKKYKFDEDSDDNSSILYVQSGQIEGNPFLVYKEMNVEMITHTYTGSITVSVTKRNSKGEVYHSSEILHASIKKEKPEYFDNTYLVYANDAAPHLCFSRKPVLSSHLEEKELEKFVKNKKKELDKLAKKELTKENGFTPLGNDKFDTLFNATNRNNEVEFRLLFTPLAQNNLVNLINSKEPFGDDFSYSKKKCLNYIKSNHSQYFDYVISPSYFESLDIESAREKFNDYSNNYFKNLYFDLLPIISIPELQQHKAEEYIYDKKYFSNFNRFEQESICNGLNFSNLLHEDTYKDLSFGIVKTSLTRKEDDADLISATCYSYGGEEKVEYIPRTASDGKTHMVPVHYVEYYPIKKENLVKITRSTINRKNINSNISNNSQLNNSLIDYAYQKGILAVLLKDKHGNNNVDLTSLLK